MTGILFALVTPMQAFAFAPHDDVYQGTEPTRLQRLHPAHQARLKQEKSWQQFTHGEGQGWEARFDQQTGRPHRAWGPGIDLGSTENMEEVELGLRRFLERNPGLTSVPLEQLTLSGGGYIERTDTWYVELEQQVGEKAVPVWRSHVTARIRFGKLILLGVNTYPNATGQGTTPEIAAETAVEVALDLGPEPFNTHTLEAVELVLLPEETPEGIRNRLCWEVRTRTAEPAGIWVSHVDAQNADLVNVYNEVRYASGTVHGTHDSRTVNGDVETSPLPYARIQANGERVYSNEYGEWETSGSDTPVVSLNGTYVRVVNGQGDEGEADLTSEDFNWSTNEGVSIAELDSYVFLHHVRDWGMEFAPEMDFMQDKLKSYVNLDGTCNAYFNGNVNFYRKGDGCNNTGRIADVNYHEWGHGFHAYSLLTGDYDGSVSEGIGDTVAFLQTGDPTIAPYFGTNGWGIREVDSDRVYPNDWVNEVHTDGLIFAGAVWDLWGLLAEDMGSEDSRTVVSQLFADAIKAGPTVPDTYDEFVSADDDDGDLSNGTPHQCQILEAFQRHGLGPAGSSGVVQLQHEPLVNHAFNQGISIEADLYNLVSECADFIAQEGSVHYSLDSGSSWASEPLERNGTDSIDGVLDEIPYGSIVHYYLEVESEGGAVQSAPRGRNINPHSFFVGDLSPIHCDDFEDGMGAGYTHELVEGSEEEGADDWQLGEPRGEGGDPDFAYSGDHAWGNDLGWGVYNGEYKNDKFNRLNSAPIDVSGADGPLILQFRRWLTVEDGYYDHARVLADGVQVWSNHETSRNNGDEHHIDQAWALHTLEIEDIDGDGEVTVSWEIESDQGLAFGGWNIDDVCVYEVLPYVEPSEEQNVGTQLIGAAGCSCSASGSPSKMGFVVLLGGLAGILRRRRGH